MHIDIKLKNGKTVQFTTIDDEPCSSTWLREVMAFVTKPNAANTLARLHRPVRVQRFESMDE